MVLNSNYLGFNNIVHLELVFLELGHGYAKGCYNKDYVYLLFKSFKPELSFMSYNDAVKKVLDFGTSYLSVSFT